MPTIVHQESTQQVFEIAEKHATRKVPVFPPDTLVSTVFRELMGRQYDYASHIVICEDSHFLGTLCIENLLTASAGQTIGGIMDRNAPFVAPGIDQEVAAWRAVRHRESALCVLNDDGRFVGIIPPDKLLEILLLEHEEDLTRYAGFLKDTSGARETSAEPARRRFRHRLPWLLVGLVGALLAADVVGRFEAVLQQSVLLAFFLPSIVYLADAVGTQTETVVIRGLSVGVKIGQMVWSELIAGFSIAATLALVAAPLVWWRWGDGQIATCVALAVFAACSTATVTAMIIPRILTAFGLDPAFGSGPLATVIQDLLSILIYFAVATRILSVPLL